jgi:hypothetical protein
VIWRQGGAVGRVLFFHVSRFTLHVFLIYGGRFVDKVVNHAIDWTPG